MKYKNNVHSTIQMQTHQFQTVRFCIKFIFKTLCLGFLLSSFICLVTFYKIDEVTFLSVCVINQDLNITELLKADN